MLAISSPPYYFYEWRKPLCVDESVLRYTQLLSMLPYLPAAVMCLVSHFCDDEGPGAATNLDRKFSALHFRERTQQVGRALCEKLRALLDRQLFQINIQAAANNKVVARETISAFRKDVTSKCYGGDISRKRKLLEKQKEGKKRMRKMGAVAVPNEAFQDMIKLR